MNAQDARILMNGNGWLPLCRLGSAEHWVKGPQRIVLYWTGELPNKVSLDNMKHGYFDGDNVVSD